MVLRKMVMMTFTTGMTKCCIKLD